MALDVHDAMADVVEALTNEVARANERWGVDHDPSDGTWLAVLAEEFGEVGRCLNEPWPRPLSFEETEALYGELAQVAAVAVRWMVRIRRREKGLDAS